MSKRNWKNEALDIVSNLSESRSRDLLLQVIKLRPSVVVQGFSYLQGDKIEAPALQPSFVVQLLASEAPTINKTILRASAIINKIPCIKLYRMLSGEGLKEAKDAVESICYAFPGTLQVFNAPSVVSGNVVINHNFESTAHIAAIASQIYAQKYQEAYSTFQHSYALDDTSVTEQLFKTFLTRLFIID